MDIQAAQSDMRQAYFGGGAGVLASGLVWLSAGIVTFTSTTQISVLIFFFGGMCIHPLGIAISKVFKRTGQHRKGNPLASIAIESTVLLFVGLFLAYIVFQVEPNWFFPTMLMIIGARYTLFQTLYGIRTYWILGGLLILTGMACLMLSAPFYAGALLGGAVELIFAFVIMGGQKGNQEEV